jgi:hypothetical protein
LLRLSLVGDDEFDAAVIIEEEEGLEESGGAGGRASSSDSTAASRAAMRDARRGQETINPLEGVDLI